ncbi:hypothetical protein N8T08_009218 [Aspergillus melleus]|uniref:Uncharacterized protein n=1 Tax=Aspergillus melleus TaxID=138277 RepID=A0ACC3ATZ0_9EURO|nr:hypothetical protein N8T08_009218 [Aspergillus melleus]
MSCINSGINIVVVLLSMGLVDWVGRRPLVLLDTLIELSALLTMGSLGTLSHLTKAIKTAITATIIVCGAVFSLGWVPLSHLVVAETPTARLRDITYTTGALFNVLIQFGVSFSVPYMVYEPADLGSKVGLTFAGCALFYVIRICLNIGGQTPGIQLAAWLSPILVTGISTALLVGKIINKVPDSSIMLFAMLCYFLPSLLMALRTVHSTYWTYLFFATIIAIFAMDSSLPAATIIFANAVPRQCQGMGSSVITAIVV